MNYKDHPDYKDPKRYIFGVEGAKQYIIYHEGRMKLHREDGPAYECPEDGTNYFLYDEIVDPEEVVDLWLMRGIFCYYDKDKKSLIFE